MFILQMFSLAGCPGPWQEQKQEQIWGCGRKSSLWDRQKGEFSALQQVFYPQFYPISGNPSPEAAPGLCKSVAQGSASPEFTAGYFVFVVFWSKKSQPGVGYEAVPEEAGQG